MNAFIMATMDRIKAEAKQAVDVEASLGGRIRRLAKRQKLVAMRRRGLWYIADYDNSLQSSERGMDDDEALEFLLQE